MTEQWIWPHPEGITDLCAEDLQLASPQLAAAAELWRDRRKELAQSQQLAKFSERLDRRFAIESNVIEKVFQLDRGITEVLVEEGIKASLIPHDATDKPRQYVVDILQSGLQAQEWMFERFVVNNQPITVFSIKELHQLLTMHQLKTEGLTSTGERIEIELVHGDWKKSDNQVRKDDVVLRYCPPEHVASEMDRLFEFHAQHMSNAVAPEVSAAWLHHRFTQIHPFQDGNGRVARCLAGLIFVKAGLFPLIVLRDETNKYIEALELADAGNLGPLVEFFVKGQLQRFDLALNLAADVEAESGGTLGLAIESIGDTLKRREAERLEARKRLLENADQLLDVAKDTFRIAAEKLTAQGLDSFAIRSDNQNDYHYQGQAFGFARAHGYYADTGTFRGWAKIRFETKPFTQLLIHLHARGRDLGVIAGAAIFEIIEDSHEDGAAHREAIDIVLAPFEFYSTETLEQVKARFRPWLEETLTLALAQVQKFI